MAMVGAAMSEPLRDMSVRFHSLVYFKTTGGPVRQLIAGQVGLEPIQVGVGASEESRCIADAEPAVGEPQQRAVTVDAEFVAHHTVFDNRLLPLVFEHVR